MASDNTNQGALAATDNQGDAKLAQQLYQDYQKGGLAGLQADMNKFDGMGSVADQQKVANLFSELTGGKLNMAIDNTQGGVNGTKAWVYSPDGSVNVNFDWNGNMQQDTRAPLSLGQTIATNDGATVAAAGGGGAAAPAIGDAAGAAAGGGGGGW